MEALLQILSPVDIVIGAFSFLIGSLATVGRFKSNPYRNLSIFLQVSLLIIKMAKSYYDAHPKAKEHLDAQLAQRLDRISDQLYEYMHGRREPADSGQPVG